jgi:hypothetical protein
MILGVTKVIPFGLVVFFPSYKYLEGCLQIWGTGNNTNTNTYSSQWKGKESTVFRFEKNKVYPNGSILEKLQKVKNLFMEPKESTDVDGLLKEYTDSIRACEQGNSQKVLRVGEKWLIARTVQLFFVLWVASYLKESISLIILGEGLLLLVYHTQTYNLQRFKRRFDILTIEKTIRAICGDMNKQNQN